MIRFQTLLSISTCAATARSGSRQDPDHDEDMAWLMLPATSSSTMTRILNPRFLTYMASCDVEYTSKIYQAHCPPRHRPSTRIVNHRFLSGNGSGIL